MIHVLCNIDKTIPNIDNLSVKIIYSKHGVQLTDFELKAAKNLYNNILIKQEFQLNNISWSDQLKKYILFHTYLKNHDEIYAMLMSNINDKLHNIHMDLKQFDHIPEETWIFLIGCDLFFKSQKNYIKSFQPIFSPKAQKEIQDFYKKNQQVFYSFIVNGKKFYCVPASKLDPKFIEMLENKNSEVQLLSKIKVCNKTTYYRIWLVNIKTDDFYMVQDFVYAKSRDASGLVQDLYKQYGKSVTMAQQEDLCVDSSSERDQNLLSMMEHLKENTYVTKQGDSVMVIIREYCYVGDSQPNVTEEDEENYKLILKIMMSNIIL